MDMQSATLLRLLGDPTRLRLLRALSQEALNVSELTAVLGVAQSGVSRHLALLREAGLVAEERSGGFAWYRLAPEAGNGANAALWSWLRAEFDRPTRETRADDARLAEVRRLRRESFTEPGRHGDDRRQLVPGRSWAAWSRALGALLPPLVVADLGCGEGYLTLEAAAWAKKVIAIDRSPEVLARGRDLARRRKVKNIVWRKGDLEHVPIDDASVDVVLLSQALHHAAEPSKALAEARRILRPGGRLIVLDLRAHGEEWVRQRLGDRWLGFSDEELRRLLGEAGFIDVRVRVGARRTDDPFTVLIASGAVIHNDTLEAVAGPRARRSGPYENARSSMPSSSSKVDSVSRHP
jgi:ArsR family transcriptional regulator